jgi:hypothetical protein
VSEFDLGFEFPRTEIVPSEQPHQPRIAKPYLLLWVVVFTHPDAPKCGKPNGVSARPPRLLGPIDETTRLVLTGAGGPLSVLL